MLANIQVFSFILDLFAGIFMKIHILHAMLFLQPVIIIIKGTFLEEHCILSGCTADIF
jgi:uncharacterized membrane protein YcaP (DUF421 family)